MTAEPTRDLRRLAKRYRISFRPPSDSSDWPLEHKPNFNNVQKIAELRFETYSASIDIRSSEEPWREAVKSRAAWLATRAASLFKQQRNESGWRFGLENDVLRRFTVEVACRKCRARLWRSEIEAASGEDYDLAASLQERRKNRKPCECSANGRPNDFYEMGTNSLFEDRTQVAIVHDPLIKSQLPKQEPDRIYGLQATTNFEEALSAPSMVLLEGDDGLAVGDSIRTSPFKEGTEPLLFPFLILEAKSESAAYGFEDIQMQTAFPIYALLKIQEELQATSKSGVSPLVWFFASRGDAWRVYGCYVSNDGAPRYEIAQLWDGSVQSKDGALQLLLIVDYVFDWARDIYRPSILRQLRSLSSGEAYENISIAEDSDILSMRRHIRDWLPALPSVFDSNPAIRLATPSFVGHDATPTPISPLNNEDHQRLLPVQVPPMKLGAFRSASIFSSKIMGIYLDERNVQTFLELSGGVRTSLSGVRIKPGGLEGAARKMISYLSRWNELIILTAEDIYMIHSTWTRAGSPDEAALPSPMEKFYFLAEFATFVDSKWNIVKQLFYLAVSVPAVDIIVKCAKYKAKPAALKHLPTIGRSCDKDTLMECLQCLLSGSSDQVFRTALSRVLVSLYSVPRERYTDGSTEKLTEALGFGSIKRPRVAAFIQQFHTIGSSLIGSLQGIGDQPNMLLMPGLETVLRSIFYSAEGKITIADTDRHEAASCNRCRQLGIHESYLHHMPPPSENAFSAYGMNLVAAADKESWSKPICLFASNVAQGISDVKALETIVADLLQGGSYYHAIQTPESNTSPYNVLSGDILWNTPILYHPGTTDQLSDINDWRSELALAAIGVLAPTVIHIDKRVEQNQNLVWNHLQLLLHFLSKKKTYSEAKAWAEAAHANYKSHAYRTEDESRENFYLSLKETDAETRDQDHPSKPYSWRLASLLWTDG